MQEYLLYIRNLGIENVIDILLVSIVVYQVYLWVYKTTALPVLQGFVVFIILTFLTRFFELETLNFIFEKVFSLLLFSLIVLFPSEVKRAFSRIGVPDLIPMRANLKKKNVDILLQLISDFRSSKTGALIIFRKKDSLANIIDSGVEMHATINRQLLASVFQKNSPLHDGAVVISKNIISAAACFIPTISFGYNTSQKMGTRHRAALSLSEHTDASIVIVSEETGNVSIAENGTITSNISQRKLRNYLERI